LDELLFFLDDPPSGTGDRWQKGADLCQRHGIKTSRMAVWRFYRGHILQWRLEQNPRAAASHMRPHESKTLTLPRAGFSAKGPPLCAPYHPVPPGIAP
jgi:hypothetical protein